MMMNGGSSGPGAGNASSLNRRQPMSPVNGGGSQQQQQMQSGSGSELIGGANSGINNIVIGNGDISSDRHSQQQHHHQMHHLGPGDQQKSTMPLSVNVNPEANGSGITSAEGHLDSPSGDSGPVGVRRHTILPPLEKPPRGEIGLESSDYITIYYNRGSGASLNKRLDGEIDRGSHKVMETCVRIKQLQVFI